MEYTIRISIADPELELEKKFRVSDKDLIIGSLPQSDIFINDPYVSRRHAVVSFDATESVYTIRDLESKNGTALLKHSGPYN